MLVFLVRIKAVPLVCVHLVCVSLNMRFLFKVRIFGFSRVPVPFTDCSLAGKESWKNKPRPLLLPVQDK